MTRLMILPLIGALALAAGCEAKIGKDKDADLSNTATAEGKAEDGSVSIKAPGVDIKVNIPESVRERASIKGDSDIVYPGSRVDGVHIEAGTGDSGAVEIRFASDDTADKLAAWYRDGARKDFKIDSETRDGANFMFNGHEIDDNSPFKLRLSPKGTGTEGVLSIQDNK